MNSRIMADDAPLGGQADNSNSFLGQERVITLLSIKEMQEKLVDKGFIRVHKSYIVALNRIKAVDGNQIIIQDKKSIPLSDMYRTRFFAMLNQYIMDSQCK